MSLPKDFISLIWVSEWIVNLSWIIGLSSDKRKKTWSETPWMLVLPLKEYLITPLRSNDGTVNSV